MRRSEDFERHTGEDVAHADIRASVLGVVDRLDVAVGFDLNTATIGIERKFDLKFLIQKFFRSARR